MSLERDAGADGGATALSPALGAAFTALDRTGVRWCLLRGEADLLRPSGDVDLLVASQDAVRLDRALTSVGALAQRSWARGSQRFFLLEDGLGSILLHVTTRVAFGPWYGFDLDVAAGVVARCRRRDGLPVAAPPDQVWVTLLHCLLDKGRVSDKHRRRLPELVAAADPGDEVSRAVGRRCGSAWRPAELLELVATGRWDDLEAHGPLLRGAWRRRDPAAIGRTARNAASLWAHKAIEPVTRRGPVVALLAPDGAGKTTLAVSLTTSLFAPTRRLYLGVYGQEMPRPPIPVPGLGLALRLATLRWRWLVGAYHRRRRRVVVLDRHPVESLLEPGGGGGPAWCAGCWPGPSLKPI